jgi:hypothetical protein
LCGVHIAQNFVDYCLPFCLFSIWPLCWHCLSFELSFWLLFFSLFLQTFRSVGPYIKKCAHEWRHHHRQNILWKESLYSKWQNFTNINRKNKYVGTVVVLIVW